MQIGCSECLCIAIESHRSALLKSLLQRSDVQYRDIFWAPTPSPNLWQSIEGEMERMFPVLHDMGSDIDLSIVGRDDCGHMRVEVELCSPFELFGKDRAYILVSLPMIARWHTFERFNAERILRQSGRFDYSEPQFFDVQISSRIRNGLPGPLNVPEKNWSFYTMCEYEIRNESRCVSLDSSTQVISLNEPSTLPCHMATARMFISSNQIDFTKFYGQLCRVFNINQYQMFRAKILERIQKILECGGDLNNFLLSRQVYASSTSYDMGSSFIWSTYRRLHCFDLFRTWRHMYEKLLVRVHPGFLKFNIVGIRDAHRFTSFLLRNDLSFFYISPMRNPEKIPAHWAWESESPNKSLLQPLFLQHPRMPEGLLPFARGIAQQLLALGYGAASRAAPTARQTTRRHVPRTRVLPERMDKRAAITRATLPRRSSLTPATRAHCSSTRCRRRRRCATSQTARGSHSAGSRAVRRGPDRADAERRACGLFRQEQRVSCLNRFNQSRE